MFEKNIEAFIRFMFMALSDVFLLGSAESAEFSKDLEDFVLGEVARIRSERAADLGSLEGATMPLGANVKTEQAFALLGQLTELIAANPSVIKELMPKLSGLTQLVEELRPPSTERILNTREASERIGISHVQLLRLLEAGRLGERDVEGNPRFSEQECNAYREGRRPRGRPRKSDEAS